MLLKTLKVKDNTLLRYNAGVQQFEQYLHRRKLRPRSYSATDRYMAEFFADLCDEGTSYNNATYILFGYLMLRCASTVPDKMMFPLSRNALKGWGSRYPQSSRTGADPLVWQLIANEMADNDPLLAAAVIVQLDTYARPSEILQLCKQDIIRPSTKHCRFWGIILGNSSRGCRTKTGTQDDTILLDSTDRIYAKQVLEIVYKAAPRPESRVFGNYTLNDYEQIMKAAKAKVKLGPFHLTPHTVRHSGPSIDALQRSRVPEEILARGRWKTLKSIQRYQKPGQMLASMNRISDDTWHQARLALPQLLAKLRRKLIGGKTP